MAQNQWVIDLESKVLSLVKGKTYNKLKKRYPQIMYTTSSISNDSQRNFPCVYVHELGGSEANSDLERTRINTIVAGFQIEVYSNTSQLGHLPQGRCGLKSEGTIRSWKKRYVTFRKEGVD